MNIFFKIITIFLIVIFTPVILLSGELFCILFLFAMAIEALSDSIRHFLEVFKDEKKMD